MKNKVINIIRPIENGAEKEYLKEFFRFIGCFLSDCTVDEKRENDWDRWMGPTNEEGGVDILLNYFCHDPYHLECELRGIKRIYCYFSFGKMYAEVSDKPLMSEESLHHEENESKKALLRRTVLFDLIAAIWSDEPDIRQSVRNIASIYVGNVQGDLFYYLQMKRCLRVMNMGEVLNVSNARKPTVKCVPYITQAMEALWVLYVQLEGCADPYSQYTQLKALSTIREIAAELDVFDRKKLGQIRCGNRPFCIPTQKEIIGKIQDLIEKDSQFLTVYLCLAGQYRSMPDRDEAEESCYRRMLQNIPRERPEYAFLQYKIANFFEKKKGNKNKAIDYYRAAVALDPECYQALFKLGYFAARDGRFNEAESILLRTIRAIFHGRSPEPDEYGTYPNWLALSLKESQYAFKTYILLAKISINSNREYSAKAYVGKACMAATRFDEAGLVRHASTQFEVASFFGYHYMCEPVRSIWKVLKPWSDDVVQDEYVSSIVRQRMQRWKK